MRAIAIVALATALPACHCGGDPAGYEPKPGCLAGAVCDAVEDRGRFDGIAGFFGTDGVLALRGSTAEDLADLWLSRSTGDETIAAGVVVSDIDLGAEGLVVFGTPPAESTGADRDRREGGRFDVHLWRPGAAPVTLVAGVLAYDSAVCPTGAWFGAFVPEADAPTDGMTPGVRWLIELATGRAQRLDDRHVCRPTLGEAGAPCSRFTADCLAAVLTLGRYRTLATGEDHVAAATDSRATANFSPRLRWLVTHRLEDSSADSRWREFRWADPGSGVEFGRHRFLWPALSNWIARHDHAEGSVALTYSLRDDGWYPEQGLRFLDLEDGTIVETELRTRHPTDAVFAPDDATLAVLTLPDPGDIATDLFALALVDRRTGRATAVDDRALPRLPYGRLVRGRYEGLAFAADARHLVYFRRGEGDGSLQLAVAEVGTGERRVLGSVVEREPHPGFHTDFPYEASAHAAFSPDRRWVAWEAPDRSLQLARVDDPRPPLRIADGPVEDLALSRDHLAWIERGRLRVAALAAAAP